VVGTVTEFNVVLVQVYILNSITRFPVQMGPLLYYIQFLIMRRRKIVSFLVNVLFRAFILQVHVMDVMTVSSCNSFYRHSYSERVFEKVM